MQCIIADFYWWCLRIRVNKCKISPIHTSMKVNQDKKEKFVAIYETLADAIFRHCYFKVNNKELAQDLTQQVFMRFWVFMKDTDDINNPRALLYRIARNLVIDWYRKKKVGSLDNLIEAGFDRLDIHGENIEQTAEINNILKVLDKMSPEDQDIITWRYVEDLSPKEIAEILCEKENTVSVRLHRAVEQLKVLMKTK